MRPRATGAVREARRARSRDDWQAFLEDRAHELVPDGQLAVVGSGSGDRGFSEPSLFGSLDPDRTPADRERLADTFYARVRAAIAADPAQAVCHRQLVLLRIARAR